MDSYGFFIPRGVNPRMGNPLQKGKILPLGCRGAERFRREIRSYCIGQRRDGTSFLTQRRREERLVLAPLHLCVENFTVSLTITEIRFYLFLSVFICVHPRLETPLLFTDCHHSPRQLLLHNHKEHNHNQRCQQRGSHQLMPFDLKAGDKLEEADSQRQFVLAA